MIIRVSERKWRNSFIWQFIIASYLVCSVRSIGEKSKQMCELYAKEVYSEEEAPILLPGAVVNKVSQCGIVEVPLIVGGVQTGIKEFPHMGVLGFGTEEEINWMCGGSLISDSYVLTAAHCLKSKEKGIAKWVRLGERNLIDDADANFKQIAIEKHIAHPLYAPPKRYNDIGLLLLKEKVTFNGYIRPACLHITESIPWTTGIATGFGKTTYDAVGGNHELMKVQLPFIETVACNVAYKNDIGVKLPQGITPSQLCAGVMAGGKDTCQGDSGGPLQQVLAEPYCMYAVVGITSFGKFCGFSNSPAVYTRVSFYVPWIESIVWP